ncbi:OTU domain-containing protein 1 isoform X2 [Cottoperca gobio]|uniref:OTU domain-containing protein 1 n=1 Tax=Cottoperca gobio TaxID=56716 RepID=A0A6J2RWE9_COTGO|nr:OTU domain-containing protein 1 isoform X1 [Cottoperca gobio]XP_029313645.1 OTU domain-containing protein 1 isoform X2 [Cottoperca gobio]
MSPAAPFSIKDSFKMQLYNSVLTHYPRSSRKVTITLSTRSERLNGTTASSSDAHKPGFTQPFATSTTNSDPVREAASSANMPALSCYEASSMRPVYFTSTAEISIRRPDGVERSVPVHVVRESKTKPDSPGESILCGNCGSDVIVDLIDRLRNGTDELFHDCPQLVGNHLFNSNNVCRPRIKENKRMVENSSEDDTVSVTNAPVRSNGWALLHEEELDQPAELIQEDFRDLSSGKAAPASDEKQAFELSVLQDSPPQRFQEDTNNKVTRYLAEVEKQNKYLQEGHKYRYHIIPDGNCLYRAVCKATYGDQARHGELREQTVHHIADHLEEFNPIVEGDVGEFLISAAQDGAWAGYPELLAMSQMLNVNIHLTTGGSSESPTVSTMVHYLGEEDASKVSIWLSWLSNGHYDVLLDKSLPNPEYEDWCRHSQMQRKRDEEMAKSMAASLSKMYIEQNGSA